MERVSSDESSISSAGGSGAAATSSSSTSIARSRSRSERSREPKVKLWSNMSERKRYDALRDLYAIIKTVEHLEIAYVKDSCGKDEYTDACNALISQFKEAKRILRTFPEITDVSDFMRQFKMECPRAEDRLMRVGQPATVQMSTRAKNSAVAAAACTANFITVIDALQLNMRAKDELVPLLTNVVTSLGRVEGLPADFEGKSKINDWLSKFSILAAHQEIGEEEARQLAFELDQAYGAFHKFLKNQEG